MSPAALEVLGRSLCRCDMSTGTVDVGATVRFGPGCPAARNGTPTKAPPRPCGMPAVYTRVHAAKGCGLALLVWHAAERPRGWPADACLAAAGGSADGEAFKALFAVPACRGDAAAAFFHSDRSQLHSTLKHWHWRDERSRARRPSHAPSMPPALAMRAPTTVGSKAVELGSTQLVWHSNVVLSVFINSRYDRRRHGIACLACRSGSLVREPSWSCAAARRDGQLRRVPRATLLAASSG